MKKIYYILLAAGTLILFSTGCKKFELVTKTIYSPSEISNITYNSVNVSTEILEAGENLKTYGYCYGTESMPTVTGSKTINAGENAKTGVFTEQITELNPNTNYNVRAYATNANGTSYGEQKSFTTAPYQITDIDGNTYNTVIIGNQIWMAENLKVTHYADGTAIQLISDNTDWEDLDDEDKAYCWYDNNLVYKDTYGALYTWAAAMNGESSSNLNPSGVQGVCPDGWHLPSDDEWTELTDHLGGESVAGGKMKETGTSHWNSPNTGATNESGFSALPGGHRYNINGTFNILGIRGHWWSSTEADTGNTYFRYLANNNAEACRSNNSKSYGFSVRCIRD